MARDGNVNCPIHGTHGLLDQGKCWYCSKAGMATPTQQKKQIVRVPVPASARTSRDTRYLEKSSAKTRTIG